MYPKFNSLILTDKTETDTTDSTTPHTQIRPVKTGLSRYCSFKNTNANTKLPNN